MLVSIHGDFYKSQTTDQLTVHKVTVTPPW